MLRASPASASLVLPDRSPPTARPDFQRPFRFLLSVYTCQNDTNRNTTPRYFPTFRKARNGFSQTNQPAPIGQNRPLPGFPSEIFPARYLPAIFHLKRSLRPKQTVPPPSRRAPQTPTPPRSATAFRPISQKHLHPPTQYGPPGNSSSLRSSIQDLPALPRKLPAPTSTIANNARPIFPEKRKQATPASTSPAELRETRPDRADVLLPFYNRFQR